MYTDGTYLKNHPTWDAEDSPWKADNILRLMNKNSIQPSTVCEVGCGAGQISLELQKKLPGETEFHGYEISPQAIEICKEIESDRLKFHLSDLLEEEMAPDERFDLVLIIDVIEHVEDYFTFLRGVREKGEYKLFHIPLDLSAQSIMRAKPIIQRWKSIGHIHWFTKETALASLTDTGYEIVDYFFTSGGVEANTSRGASLLRWPRKMTGWLNMDVSARLLGGYSLMVLAK